MKTTVAVLLGLALGVLVGAGGLHQWLMPKLLASDAALLEARHKQESLSAHNAEMEAKLALLEKERSAFTAQVNAAFAPKPAGPVESVEPSDIAAPEETAELVADAAPAGDDATRENEARRREDRRGAPEGRWGGTPEEREARRQEFVTRMQENMSSFFTGELEKSSTPAMQQRLVSLEEKVYEMFDLRTQMRTAETEEEREAIGQAFGDAMNATRQLMVEQQQDMLGAIATQFGISRESDQAAFEQALRSAMESPFFSDNPGALLWNTGRTEDGGEEGGGRFGGGFRGMGGFGGGPGGGR